jgi:hypothetical protein
MALRRLRVAMSEILDAMSLDVDVPRGRRLAEPHQKSGAESAHVTPAKKTGA